MKKILAVILSLAMILSMSVCAFAEEPSESWSQDLWQAYYLQVLNNDLLDDEAKLAAVTTMDTNEVALAGAVSEYLANGGDEAVVVALNDALLAEHDVDLEGTLGDDLNGDGYLGDPADGVVYKPVDSTDVEAWTTYYTIILGEATTNPAAVITVVPEIAGNVTNGEIDMDTFTSAFPEAAKAVGGDVVNQIVWGVEDLLSTDLNSDGYVGKPDGSIDDGKLPEEDEGNGDSGSGIGGLLDTILGILGGIIGSLFPSDDPTPSEPTNPGEEDNLWDEEDPWGTDGEGSTIPDTGDTTVFAVAAVALAAGAALVMTRKKSEDAE